MVTYHYNYKAKVYHHGDYQYQVGHPLCGANTELWSDERPRDKKLCKSCKKLKRFIYKD